MREGVFNLKAPWHSVPVIFLITRMRGVSARFYSQEVNRIAHLEPASDPASEAAGAGRVASWSGFNPDQVPTEGSSQYEHPCLLGQLVGEPVERVPN